MQGPEATVHELLRGVRIRNTDDNAWLEHRMPKDMLRSHQPPSADTDTVSQLVTSLGASRHLRGLEEMLPGVPLEDCAEGMLEHALRIEPTILPGGAVPDPGLSMRSARIAGMFQEIERMNDPERLRRFEAHRREQERYFENRWEAARILADPLGRGQAPDRVALQQALALAPDLPQALLLIANGFFVQGHLDEAERYYRRLLDYPMSTASYDALVGLGNIAVLQGRFDEAAVLLERAAARNPYFPNAYASLATLYVGQKNLELAREVLRRGLQFNPANPDLEAKLRSLTSPS
jgi:tetratricopeptide (TPR) repeat protein